jgi:hypothetical protein
MYLPATNPNNSADRMHRGYQMTCTFRLSFRLGSVCFSSSNSATRVYLADWIQGNMVLLDSNKKVGNFLQAAMCLPDPTQTKEMVEFHDGTCIYLTIILTSHRHKWDTERLRSATYYGVTPWRWHMAGTWLETMVPCGSTPNAGKAGKKRQSADNPALASRVEGGLEARMSVSDVHLPRAAQYHSTVRPVGGVAILRKASTARADLSIASMSHYRAAFLRAHKTKQQKREKQCLLFARPRRLQRCSTRWP